MMYVYIVLKTGVIKVHFEKGAERGEFKRVCRILCAPFLRDYLGKREWNRNCVSEGIKARVK